jgi:beta-hydroxylase
MTILITAVAIYAFSIVFVRLRNRAHLSWSRQLTDFSTFMVPFNLPAYLLSCVPTRSHLPVTALDKLQFLQNNWETIRDEALALYDAGRITAKDDLPGSNFYKDNRWKSFYLKANDIELPSARLLAPKTLALINQVPGMNLALFAVLMPGKKLGAHCDPFAYTLRYSLGLSTPNSEKCGLMVNGENYIWRDGDGIVFDETYLHSAYNDTDTPRIILMTDVDRPLRFKPLQWLYGRFGRFFNGLFYIDNIDTSRSGIGNRLKDPVVRYKAKLQSFKARHRSIYRIGKWTLHLCLVALLVKWAL